MASVLLICLLRRHYRRSSKFRTQAVLRRYRFSTINPPIVKPRKGVYERKGFLLACLALAMGLPSPTSRKVHAMPRQRSPRFRHLVREHAGGIATHQSPGSVYAVSMAAGVHIERMSPTTAPPSAGCVRRGRPAAAVGLTAARRHLHLAGGGQHRPRRSPRRGMALRCRRMAHRAARRLRQRRHPS